jgi:hypothetical protein
VSDVVVHQDPKLTKAADAFIEDMEQGTYGVVNGVPVWTNCSLRHAFEQGVAWEQAQTKGEGK